MIQEWDKARMKDEDFNSKMAERIKDISKHYKYVKTCVGCKLLFGMDSHGKYDSGYCPICKTEFQSFKISPWDRHRQRFKRKDDSGGSNKARGASQ